MAKARKRARVLKAKAEVQAKRKKVDRIKAARAAAKKAAKAKEAKVS